MAGLGSFVWSADSKKIAYIAEVKNQATNKCLLTSKYEKPGSTQEKSEPSKDDDLVTEDNYQEVSTKHGLALSPWFIRLDLNHKIFLDLLDRNMPISTQMLGESSWLESVNQL